MRCRLRRDFAPAWRGACVFLVVAAPECSRCIGKLMRILRRSPSLPLWARHPRSATRARREEGQEVDDHCRLQGRNLRFPLLMTVKGIHYITNQRIRCDSSRYMYMYSYMFDAILAKQHSIEKNFFLRFVFGTRNLPPLGGSVPNFMQMGAPSLFTS